jgi:hypothetical protein
MLLKVKRPRWATPSPRLAPPSPDFACGAGKACEPGSGRLVVANVAVGFDRSSRFASVGGLSRASGSCGWVGTVEWVVRRKQRGVGANIR